MNLKKYNSLPFYKFEMAEICNLAVYDNITINDIPDERPNFEEIDEGFFSDKKEETELFDNKSTDLYKTEYITLPDIVSYYGNYPLLKSEFDTTFKKIKNDGIFSFIDHKKVYRLYSQYSQGKFEDWSIIWRLYCLYKWKKIMKISQN